MKWNFIKSSVLYLATVLIVAGNVSEAKAARLENNIIAEKNQSITSIESMTYFLGNKNALSVLSDVEVQGIKEVTVTSQEGEEVKIATSTNFVELKEDVSSYKEMLKHIAIVKGADKVNVRSTATTDDEENIVGKAYNNALVLIEDVVEMEDGIWYQVVSGNVEGYIRSDYLITGKEARNMAESMLNQQGVVEAETLNLREEPNVDCEVIGKLQKGDVCVIEGEAENGFVKVTTASGEVGYVSSEYLTMEGNFEWALTIEEYEKKLEEEKAEQILMQAKADAEYIKSLMTTAYNNYVEQLNAEWFRKAQGFAKEYVSYAEKLVKLGKEHGLNDVIAYGNDAIAKGNSYINHAQAKINGVESELAQQQAPKPAPQQPTQPKPAPQQPAPKPVPQQPAASTNVSANVTAIRQAIVAEAIKWPGKCNYRLGGTNLTVGGQVDCSGFTLCIYKKVAGITLNRTSAAQSQMGRRVPLNAVQPGDLVFYYGSNGIGHVAIYIGDRKIVHAKNPNAGIGIDNMYYTNPAWAISLF